MKVFGGQNVTIDFPASLCLDELTWVQMSNSGLSLPTWYMIHSILVSDCYLDEENFSLLCPKHKVCRFLFCCSCNQVTCIVICFSSFVKKARSLFNVKDFHWVLSFFMYLHVVPGVGKGRQIPVCGA